MKNAKQNARRKEHRLRTFLTEHRWVFNMCTVCTLASVHYGKFQKWYTIEKNTLTAEEISSLVIVLQRYGMKKDVRVRKILNNSPVFISKLPGCGTDTY